MKRPPFKRSPPVVGAITLSGSAALLRDMAYLGATENLPTPKVFETVAGELRDLVEVAKYFMVGLDTILIEKDGIAVFGPLANDAYTVSGVVDDLLIVAAGGIPMTTKNEEILAELVPTAKKIGFAFDPVVLGHAPTLDRTPEGPVRVARAIEYLRNHSILKHFVSADGTEPSSYGTSVPSRNAVPDEIYRVHDKAVYQKFIEAGESLSKEVELPTDVYCNEQTSQKAVLAACGMAIDSLRLVADPSAHLDGAFCLIRPPGHHCGHRTPNGFCLVNNVVVAVAALLKEKPDARVAIVDCDVHHGEGTQSLVEQDSRILYYSTHRCDKGSFFPYGQGKREAYGANGQCINVAFDTEAHLPATCYKVMSDLAFNLCTERVLIPALRKFSPTVVAISCGFDALYGDQLGRMAVTIHGYRNLILALQKENYKIVSVLEGGYNSEAVSHGAIAVFGTMLFGEDAIKLLNPIDPLKSGHAQSFDVNSQITAATPQSWDALRIRHETVPNIETLKSLHTSWISSTIDEVLAHPYLT